MTYLFRVDRRNEREGKSQASPLRPSQRLWREDLSVSEESPTVNSGFKETPSGTTVLETDSFDSLAPETLRGGKTFTFETDINQLLGIIINSLYTNKDIFLRELISNASDAIDKIRYQSLLDRSVLDDNPDLQLYIRAFPDEMKIVIRDDGHGMTRGDLIRELGTIARSGTKHFLEEFAKGTASDMNLIGQFGVGFYSAFLVADTVMVTSKHNNDPDQWVWISTADGKFSVHKDPRGNTLKRGTEVTLFLKEGMDKYVESKFLEQLVARYSEFVPYPINLWKQFEKEMTEEEYQQYRNQLIALGKIKGDDDETIDGEPSDDDEIPDEDDGEFFDDEEHEWSEDDEPEFPKDDDEEELTVTSDDEKKKKKNEKRKVQFEEWKVVNQNQPIWTRPVNDVYREEYQNFYKANVRSNNVRNPLDWIHFHIEGNIEFSSILYIPKKHSDRWTPMNQTDGITLYVKRVMITKDVKGFLPPYLGFVTGVVDSRDLPLHISRELLQKSKMIGVIKKKLVSKVFSLIKKIAREERQIRQREEQDRIHAMMDRPVEGPDEEQYPYTKFWEDWGAAIRQGIITDESSRKELIPLVRYYSTKSEDVLTSFEDYVARMPEEQPSIYYLSGSNFEEVRTSLFLEKLKEKNFEVLYFIDPIDEYMISYVKEFAGIKLVSVVDSEFKLGDEKEKSHKEEWKRLKKEYKPLLKFLEDLIGSDIMDVRLGRRLVKSMACVVAPKYGLSAHKIRLLKQQAQATGIDELNKMMMKQRVLEVNPYHANVKLMLERIKKNPRDKLAKQIALLMFDTALVRSGYDLGTNSDMAQRIMEMMKIVLEDSGESDRTEGLFGAATDIDPADIDIDNEDENVGEVDNSDILDLLGEDEEQNDEL